MFGFFNLCKPLHCTSHDCVAQLRRLCQQKRVGHGGTLDPLATGVLPIAVGMATRLLPYLAPGKQYRGVIRFGVRTASDDLDGEVIYQEPCDGLTLEPIQAILPAFLGKTEQIPPQYSAIQVGGKRLYALARAGIVQEVPKRWVDIQDLQVIHWQPGLFPELTLRVVCGEGTYIRALARDIGDRLGVGATLAGLERERSGGLDLANSVTLETLKTAKDAGGLDGVARYCIDPQSVLGHLPRVTLAGPLIDRWFKGQRLLLPDLPLGTVRVVTDQGQGVGIAQVTPEPQGTVLRPKVVLERSETIS